MEKWSRFFFNYTRPIFLFTLILVFDRSFNNFNSLPMLKLSILKQLNNHLSEIVLQSAYLHTLRNCLSTLFDHMLIIQCISWRCYCLFVFVSHIFLTTVMLAGRVWLRNPLIHYLHTYKSFCFSSSTV